jgi:hypothetical protein
VEESQGEQPFRYLANFRMRQVRGFLIKAIIDAGHERGDALTPIAVRLLRS